MTPVNSTHEILALKVLNRDIDKKWIDWAIEMLRHGYDTENLIILAGESFPNNQFELHKLTDKVLSELGLDYSKKEQVIKNYASYLVDLVLTKERDAFSVLKKLKDICIELDHVKFLYDFYLFYYAMDDLLDSEVQWYIDGVDKNNIDKEITKYFKEWLTDNPIETKTKTA